MISSVILFFWHLDFFMKQMMFKVNLNLIKLFMLWKKISINIHHRFILIESFVCLIYTLYVIDIPTSIKKYVPVYMYFVKPLVYK